ncbi:MAG: hypothetical protein IPK33_13715 [Gemmatimonadetes bacterium]|nr:hypothetical protein [Gemmatimonadota bacterium]
MERFLPSAKFANPVDMEFGPNGDLYVMEYGTTWSGPGNDDARLIRIEFNAGNRAPVAVARANKTIGRDADARGARRPPRRPMPTTTSSRMRGPSVSQAVGWVAG